MPQRDNAQILKVVQQELDRRQPGEREATRKLISELIDLKISPLLQVDIDAKLAMLKSDIVSDMRQEFEAKLAPIRADIQSLDAKFEAKLAPIQKDIQKIVKHFGIG